MPDRIQWTAAQRRQRTLPSAVTRLMQVLEGLAHRHENSGLHSELASGLGGAVGWAVLVVAA